MGNAYWRLRILGKPDGTERSRVLEWSADEQGASIVKPSGVLSRGKLAGAMRVQASRCTSALAPAVLCAL
jgi:hypothetical protein